MKQVCRLLSGLGTSQMIGEHTKEWDRTKAPDISAHPSGSSSGHVIEWTKPAYGKYKCNIVALFYAPLNMVGIGICIRND